MTERIDMASTERQAQLRARAAIRRETVGWMLFVILVAIVGATGIAAIGTGVFGP
jgi:hypothetical protein